MPVGGVGRLWHSLWVADRVVSRLHDGRASQEQHDGFV
jgi:hypothetical protein